MRLFRESENKKPKPKSKKHVLCVHYSSGRPCNRRSMRSQRGGSLLGFVFSRLDSTFLRDPVQETARRSWHRAGRAAVSAPCPHRPTPVPQDPNPPAAGRAGRGGPGLGSGRRPLTGSPSGRHTSPTVPSRPPRLTASGRAPGGSSHRERASGRASARTHARPAVGEGAAEEGAGPCRSAPARPTRPRRASPGSSPQPRASGERRWPEGSKASVDGDRASGPRGEASTPPPPPNVRQPPPTRATERRTPPARACEPRPQY